MSYQFKPQQFADASRLTNDAIDRMWDQAERAAKMSVYDQEGLGFAIEQTSYVESQVNEIRYPDITYQDLVPLDFSADDWAKSITFFASDKIGAAKLFNHLSDDIPNADVSRTKHEEPIHMAAIGYTYTMEEMGSASRLNLSLEMDRAMAARRAYEEFMEEAAFLGIPGIETGSGSTGLFNNANVTIVEDSGGAWTAANIATNAKTDINNALINQHTAANTVEIADTVLMPTSNYLLLATTQNSTASDISVLEYILRSNPYTATTGQPLMIRAERQLDALGTSVSPAGGRMVCYSRRDPTAIKMHVPMQHRFLPPQGPYGLTFKVPGIFRTAGLEIRRRGSVRYVDGI